MFQQSVLANGIRVLTDSIPQSRACALGLLVEAGPFDDPTGGEGLAHLAEHMAFQGTCQRDALEIARVMDRAGGRMGAFTGRDFTCYQATVLDEYLPFALDLFGDVLLNSTYPEELLKREIAAIQQEIGMAHDDPSRRAAELARQVAYRQHPFGQSIAGTKCSVGRLTREDVICFVGMNYLPKRLMITAAGRVDHADFVSQVEDGFWRMIGERPSTIPARPKFYGGVQTEDRNLSQAYFSIAIPAPEYSSSDRYTIHVLNTLLGGGISSRLFRRMREELGLVYDISSEYLAYRDAGLWTIEGSTKPELVQDVIGLALAELAQLTNDQPVEAEELWHAKMSMRGRHLLADEDPETRMTRLCTQEFYFGRHLPSDEVLRGIDQVTMETLEAYCAGPLPQAMNNIAVAVVGPDAMAQQPMLAELIQVQEEPELDEESLTLHQERLSWR